MLARKPLTAILASPAAGGTLSAVRQLGASGIEIGVVSNSRFSAASWSRYAKKVYSAPNENDPHLFIRRIIEIGAENPGQILLPTSDETAWLYTKNAAVLERNFCLYQTPITTLQRILDKGLLANAATRVGIDILPTWDPLVVENLSELAATLPYPILIKPRTHIHRFGSDKGFIVRSNVELISKYAEFVERERARTAYDPTLFGAGVPLLQKFVTAKDQGVLSITGFLDRSGEQFVTRRATKVFKRMQPTGVGVCFESLPDDLELSEAVLRLCRELGYFGIFEVEFLWFAGKWALIDFNPRLFNQVAMDISRGMPLPLLACLDAAGETSALHEAVKMAKANQDGSQVVFCDRFTLCAILVAQTLTGRISRTELRYWRNWMKRYAANSVNAVANNDDPMPGVMHVLSEFHLGLKAIPRFLSSLRRPSAAAFVAAEEKLS